ncbi:MAG: shikimate dehydrogenase [Eubacteriales bacterium]
MAKSFPVVCSSIAGSIGGMGVAMHNAAFAHLGMKYVYVSFEPDNLQQAVQSVRNLGFRGMGVTMPYKLDVIQYLDKLDASAKEIGAVNTIVNDDGILTGYNTDYMGAITALEKVTDLKDRKIAIIGAGGAGKAVTWGLKKYTSNITIYNIFEDEGRAAADKFGVAYAGVPDLLDADTDYDILVNCTSVGFKTEETILTRDRFRPGSIVLDAVFIPIETTFVKEARVAGCTAIEGYKMLLYQACGQFELYTGVPAPFAVMEKAMIDYVQDKK